jgi:hypothetical protein
VAGQHRHKFSCASIISILSGQQNATLLVTT